MKLALLIVLAFVVGTLGAHFLLADPGYVVINFRNTIIEMSVPVLLLLLGTLALLVWLIVKLIRAPRKLGEAAAQYRGRRAGKRFTQGLIEIAEGNYAKGERMLTRGASYADAPLMNYLAAARAAQLQNEDERRDNWLKLAFEKQPEASSAILLTQAELQIAHEQYERAQATLKQLDEQEEGRGQAAVLLAKLYHQLGDWRALAELLPRLRKLGKPAPDVLDGWAVEVHREQFRAAGTDSAEIDGIWQQVSKPLKANVSIRVAYVEALRRAGESNRAERELVKMLKTTWDPALVLQYGETRSDDPGRQLKQAENWLTKHDEDAALLLTAGRLCMANKLWGKARSYLESSLAIAATPAAFATYGQLLTQLGESGAAADAFRKGLTLVDGERQLLPGPQTQ